MVIADLNYKSRKNQPECAYVTVGAFQHGGGVGVTNATKDNQLLTKKICELVGLAFPEELFSSVTIVRDTYMPIHRDSFNDHKTYNLVIPLDVTTDAAVWEELQPGDPFFGTIRPWTSTVERYGAVA